MECEAKTLLLKNIPQAEYETIGEAIRKKIEGVLNEHINDFVTAKSYFETTRVAQDDKFKNKEEELRVACQERDDSNIKFEALQSQFDETVKSLTGVNNNIHKFNDDIQRLERISETLRRERNEAIDEKDLVANMLKLREAELSRVKIDLDESRAELKVAIQAKCSAIALNEDIHSKQSDLSQKEKFLESEREQLSKQMIALKVDLSHANNELTKQRREATKEVNKLQTTILEKEEELKIIKRDKAKLQDQNKEVLEKLDSLNDKLREQKTEEERMKENLQQQLQAQTKLADVYKERIAESEAHSAELGGAVRELQRLLQEASSQYSELETRLNQNEQEAAAILLAKEDAIKELREELKHANLLLEAVKQESSEAAVSRLSPMAASASKLLKSGLTLTQLYTKFADVSRELIVEKNEKESLKVYVDTLRKEIEEKSPLIQKQKEEYDFALSSMEILRHKLNELEEENTKLKNTTSDNKSTISRLSENNKRNQETIRDLSRQICYLLSEVETVKGRKLETSPPEVQRAEMKTSKDIISKHLVTFNSVEELKVLNLRLLVSLMEFSTEKDSCEVQIKTDDSKGNKDLEVLKKYLVKFESLEQLQLINLQLLSSLKELNAEREREEMEKESKKLGESGDAEGGLKDGKKVKELQEQVVLLDKKVQNLQERETFLMKQIEIIKNQKDVYHKLIKQSKGSLVMEIASDLSNEEKDQSMETDTSEPSATKAEDKVNNISEEAKSQLENLRNEYDTYRQERIANEKLLVETIEKLREDLGTAVKERTELASRGNYNQATCVRMKSKLKALELERDALEKRCSKYSKSIINIETNLLRSTTEVMETLNKLSIAEVTIANIKEENLLLKQNENRLLKERDLQKREKHGQELVMATLEALKTKFECDETEAKLQLELKLESVIKESAAVKRKLEEEQDKIKGQLELLETQANKAKQRLEEEINLRKKANEELNECRAKLKERDDRVEALSKQLKVTLNNSKPVLDRENKIKELKEIIGQNEISMKGYEELLSISKTAESTLSETIKKLEMKLSEVGRQHEAYKKDAEKKINDLQTIEADLKNKLRTLEDKLKAMQKSHAEEQAARDKELSDLRSRIEGLGTVLNDAKERAVKAETEMRVATENIKQAEHKVQQLETEKKKLIEDLKNANSNLTTLKTELQTAKTDNNQFKVKMEAEQKSLNDQINKLNDQKSINDENMIELTKAMDLLQDQIQGFGAKITKLGDSTQAASTSDKPDQSIKQDFDKIMDFLSSTRKQKGATEEQNERHNSEKLRLHSEVETLKCQMDNLKKESEEKSQADQKKMETLNRLTENNKTLLEDKERLENKLLNAEKQFAKVETEIIQPLKLKITELETSSDQLTSQNKLLKVENKRLHDQANELIDLTNNGPDEIKRLRQEKHNISEQFNLEKEQHGLTKNKLQEQFTKLSRERDDAITSSTSAEKNIVTLRQELNATRDSLKEAKEKLSQKDLNLINMRNKETQIRQIAKKYKAQFQDLTKTLEDERKLKIGAGPSVSPETEENFKNLNEQIIVIQKENEVLQKENDNLKAGTLEREDRAKTLLKNARNRIQQLTEENKALKDISDARAIRSKGEGSSSTDSRILEIRLSRLEKEKEEEHLEKERLNRELEIMTQRMSVMQRLIDKQQGNKLSTITGEKSTNEPPTANIKPLAGPSTSSNKQAQTQPAVTVTPWRETPFASIRPMSQQTRTVVVQPTNQTATPTCSQPPISGRPQQVVHTSSTCEGVSSSPSSSHIDFVPTVSSGVHNIHHQNVIFGQVETGGSEESGSLATAHCVQPAVSIALVLPQPAQQTQDHRQADDAASVENNSVVSASNQEQVSEQSVSGSNHGLDVQSANYYREENGRDNGTVSESSSIPSGSTSGNEMTCSGSTSSGATAATSQQAASSTTSVTTSIAQQVSLIKRPHRDLSDHDKRLPPLKRSRITTVGEPTNEDMVLRSLALDVEYQVPTSSQRDQEDDILVTSDEDSPKDLEDGQDFEEEVEEESRYGLESYGRDSQDLLYQHQEVQESDINIIDEGSPMDHDNNEVEIIDDSNEVPNQSESSPLADASNNRATGSSSEEATTRSNVAGSVVESGVEAATSSQGQVSSNQPYQPRRPTSMPISNRHHVSLSYDDPGDDSIVPSTPTLFAPRRTDGFSEIVSSPHVMPVRFTFTQEQSTNNLPSNQAGVAQVASGGMDDTTIDLSQLDEGTGRSVPTTPCQVSSQESTVSSEPNRGIDSNGGGSSSIDNDASSAVVTVPDTQDQKKVSAGTSSSTSAAGGSSSEEIIEDEEGREAEARPGNELAGSSSSTSSTSSGVNKPTATTRRSAAGSSRRTTRPATRSTGHPRTRQQHQQQKQQPTPIIWQHHQITAQQAAAMLSLRGGRTRLGGRSVGSSGLDRGNYRPRPRRGVRGGYHPGGNFQNQSRF